MTIVNNSENEPILLTGTTDTTTPTTLDAAFVLKPGERIVGTAMTALFPGIAAARIYAYAHGAGASLFISHDDAA